MRHKYLVISTRDGNPVYLEVALTELGYAKSEPDANLAVKLDLARKDVALVNMQLAKAQASYRELSVKYESCKADLAKVQTNMAICD